jgi:hypothetical protein
MRSSFAYTQTNITIIIYDLIEKIKEKKLIIFLFKKNVWALLTKNKERKTKNEFTSFTNIYFY